MRSKLILSLFALACLVVAPVAAAGPGSFDEGSSPAEGFERPTLSAAPPGLDDFQWTVAPRADGYRAPAEAGAPDREAMVETQQWLAAEAVAGAGATALSVVVTAEERSRLAGAGGSQERRYLVGVAKEVGIALDFSELSLADLGPAPRGLTFGAIRGTRDGGYVWSAVIEAPGANAMRLHLTDFDLPRSASLWVYNERGQAFGPFTSRGPAGSGELWTNTVFGERLQLQLRQAGPVTAKALAVTRFVIAEVGYIGPRFEIARDDATRWDISIGKINAAGYCPDNADCVVGACETSPSPAVNLAEDAVAHILFQSGRWFYICSGGLLADEGQSGTPYFLTANHCISKDREADSLETYFHFDDPQCNCPDPPYRNYTTVGSNILSGSSTSDYTLLQLDQSPGGGVAFMGWDATPVAFSDGTPLYRISHPSGVPQAYSEHTVDTSKGTCGSWPRGNWVYSHDQFGATEGGSSGSPVLNGNGDVVGQLSGACGFNVGDVCDADSNATVDGALAAYFDQVSQWLGGGGGCTPETEVCDGVDNDCDGLVDEDGVCDPGGECTPSGDPCEANSECCSNKCRGPNGGKTCKG